MRIFEKPNKLGGWKCPVCKTDDDKEVVLVGIVGTEKGHNIQAEQIHLGCLDLVWDKSIGIVYQKIKGE